MTGLALTIRAVAPGSAIYDPASSQLVTVHDGRPVIDERGRRIWLTTRDYEALKAHPDVIIDGGRT